MPLQTITLTPASLMNDSAAVKVWQPAAAVALDSFLEPAGQSRSFFRIVARTDQGPDNIQFRMAIDDTANGDDLADAWETDAAALTFTQGARTVTVPGPNYASNASRDNGEFYVWSPPSAQAQAVSDFFFTDLDTGEDWHLTFRVGVIPPVTVEVNGVDAGSTAVSRPEVDVLPPIGNTWPSIGESPWVEAVHAVLQEMPELAGYDDPIDVTNFVHPLRMPITNLRHQLDEMDVPSTEAFGDVFTRRVGVHLYDYFHGRDRWSGVDRTAEDLQFRYIHSWYTKTDGQQAGVMGQRIGVDFCVTPSPLITFDEDYSTEQYASDVAEWLRWVLPHFEGEEMLPRRDDPSLLEEKERVQVTLCTYVETDLALAAAATAVIYLSADTVLAS